jgi:hypothetical protein
MSPREMNLGSRVVTNPLTVTNPAWQCRQESLHKSYNNHIFTGTKLLVLDILLGEEKFNQGHFVAMIAP